MSMEEEDLFGWVITWEHAAILLDFLMVALALETEVLAFLLKGLPPLGAENIGKKGMS